MKNGDVIYFKCTKGEKTSFFCMRIFTDKMKVIDSILDQLNMANGDLGLVYIIEKEFNDNILIPSIVQIRDKEDSNKLVGEIISEGF